MMQKNNVLTGLTGAAILGVILLGFLHFVDTKEVITEKETIVREVPVPRDLGAVSGPEISGPSFTVNGVRSWPVRVPFTNTETATNTFCRIPGPPATSTLVSVGLKANATGTVYGVELHIGAFGNGTGTVEAIPEMTLIALASSTVNSDFGFAWGPGTTTPTTVGRRATGNLVVSPSSLTASGSQTGIDVKILGFQTTAGWKLDNKACTAVWQEL